MAIETGEGYESPDEITGEEMTVWYHAEDDAIGVLRTNRFGLLTTFEYNYQNDSVFTIADFNDLLVSDWTLLGEL